MAEPKRSKGKRIHKTYRKGSRSFCEYNHRQKTFDSRQQGREERTSARDRKERMRLRQLVANGDAVLKEEEQCVN